MKISNFLGLALDEFEEEIACRAFILQRELNGFAPETKDRLQKLIERLKDLPEKWGQELALAVLLSGPRS